MKIIWTLVLRYMKQNKKRTASIIVGIVFSVMMLTIVSIFTFTMRETMITQEIKDHGSWQVRFHNLDEAQFEKLTNFVKIKKCTKSVECTVHDYKNDSKFCADVELKHINYFMFGLTQKMASELGMRPLSDGEGELLPNRKMSEYDVTYHMNLLEFYGTSTADGMGKGIMMFGLLGLVTVLAAVFVYNFYAVSLYERMRYIGMLSSSGATKFQKALVILLEGFVEGVISFPVGFLFGMVVSKAGIWIFNAAGGSEEKLYMVCNITCFTVIFLCSAVMILAAITEPVRQASEVTLVEQLTATTPKGLEGQSFTNLRKKHRLIGTEGAIGIKNVYRNKPRYMVTCVLILITLCLLLDGYIYYDESDYVTDRRPRPDLGTWIEVQDRDPKVAGELLNKIRDLEEVSYAVEEISVDLMIQISGKTFQGEVRGLDDQTFQTYAGQSKADEESAQKEQFIAVADDYVIHPAEKKMGPVPGLAVGDKIKLLNESDGTENSVQIAVNGKTSEAPPYPYFSRSMEDINGFKEYETEKVHLYVRKEDLLEMLRSMQYEGEIRTFLYTDIKDEPKEQLYGWADRFLFKKDVKDCAKKDMKFQNDIMNIAESMGLSQEPLNERITADTFHKYEEREKGYAIGSASIWENEKMFNSGQALKKLFIYGVVILTFALSLTSIFQNISMSMRVRKREFAVLHSIGMTKMEIFRMVMTENAVFGIVGAVFGIPFSLFLMYQIWNDQSFVRYGTIPVKIIEIQIIILVMVMLIPAVYIGKQLKNLKMIELIKDEG